ncbi:MAG: 5'-deoxyadenosine deaminase [Oligoflexia bacterium]|nr:5'-deoxyadenosine deaminase [Oligoflexia bacterium]
MKKRGKVPAQLDKNRKRAEELWIFGGTLLTQDEERRVLRAHLRIVDGRIAAITRSRPARLSRGAKAVDARGLVLLPGFVQAHIHLCQTLFRNQADDLELMDWLAKRIWIMEAAHTPDTLKASAQLGIHELLSCGTTCILDMGTIRHTETILEAVRASGIRASVGKCLMDHPQTTPEYLREPTDAALREAQALFRKWNGREGDRIRISYAPRFVISCTERLLTEVVRLSRESGALIHTHASENRKEIEIVRELVGSENVEYLHRIGMASSRLVLAHCVWLNSREKEILRETGTHAVHCPSSNMKLASGFSPVPELRASGVNVALGADGAPCNNNLNIFQEMRLAALLHKPAHGPRSMRAQEVLDMATRAGARALGWQSDIGSIEVGKKADLVALDLNQPSNTLPAWGPLDSELLASSVVYSCQPSDVRWTWVDGKAVYRNGEVLALPKGPLMKRVRSAQLKIAKKVKIQRL